MKADASLLTQLVGLCALVLFVVSFAPMLAANYFLRALVIFVAEMHLWASGMFALVLGYAWWFEPSRLPIVTLVLPEIPALSRRMGTFWTALSVAGLGIAWTCNVDWVLTSVTVVLRIWHATHWVGEWWATLRTATSLVLAALFWTLLATLAWMISPSLVLSTVPVLIAMPRIHHLHEQLRK